MNTITIALKRKAVALFPKTSYNTLKAVKHLRRQWLKAIISLGDKWILSNKITKLEPKGKLCLS